MKNSTKKIAFIGIYIALAMIMSYIELIIPPISTAVPGIKMGLPNIIIICVLYKMGFRYAFLISIIRVLLISMLFGNAMTMVYSLAGAVLSILIMAILKKYNVFSIIGVSVCGGVTHNLGQILAAMLLLENVVIGYYMIVLAITGTIAGVLIGIIASYIVKRINNI